MKKGIHPDNYREVVFKDMSNEETFITRSTVNSKETIEIDGVTYPLVKLEITSSSHPFFTGIVEILRIKLYGRFALAAFYALKASFQAGQVFFLRHLTNPPVFVMMQRSASSWIIATSRCISYLSGLLMPVRQSKYHT